MMSKEATARSAMKLALEALENNRRTHYYCEDTWYSCPKHEEGCANESEGDECNCGADKANVEIDGAITALREALAQQALDKKAENARELGLMPYNGGDYEQPSHKFHLTQQQDPKWKCYLFGNKPETGHYGIVYIPSVGNVPNWFIRWMMKVCLGCTWVREQK